MRSINMALAVALAPSLANAASLVDGMYKGGNTLGANRNGRCPPGFSFTINVVDSAFNWTLPSGERILVTVGPDGSFTAQNGRRYLQGRISNGSMTAHTTNEYCDYEWSLTR